MLLNCTLHLWLFFLYICNIFQTNFSISQVLLCDTPQVRNRPEFEVCVDKAAKDALEAAAREAEKQVCCQSKVKLSGMETR